MYTKRKQIALAQERKKQFPENNFFVIQVRTKTKGRQYYLEVHDILINKNEKVVYRTNTNH